jgi:hypothetical protein
MIFLQSVASSVPLLHDDNTLAINELPPFCLAWSSSLGMASARQLHRICERCDGFGGPGAGADTGIGADPDINYA